MRALAKLSQNTQRNPEPQILNLETLDPKSLNPINFEMLWQRRGSGHRRQRIRDLKIQSLRCLSLESVL